MILKLCMTVTDNGFGIQHTVLCTLLPSNQSFYRQITSHEKGGGVSGVGQC